MIQNLYPSDHIINIRDNFTDYLYIINETKEQWTIVDKDENSSTLPKHSLAVVYFKEVERIIHRTPQQNKNNEQRKLSKEEFCSILERLKEAKDLVDKVDDLFNKSRENIENDFVNGASLQISHESTVVKLLKFIMNDQDDLIGYFIYELDYGRKYEAEYAYREGEAPMMTVNEVSKITGVSIRALQYYDTIGLLKPVEYTASGYRLYDDTSLERLQQILLFRELEFPLKEIKGIIDAPNFDRNKALEQQIELLTMKKEHLENLINLARGIKGIGTKYMDFKAFDTRKIDEYSKRAKELWGQTPEYKEYEEKTKNWTEDDEVTVANEFMKIFVEFGQMKEMNPSDEQVQTQVKKLQDYITEHFYTCSVKILQGLGRMYAGGGELTENIDVAGGTGTAEFASKAIDIFAMNRM